MDNEDNWTALDEMQFEADLIDELLCCGSYELEKRREIWESYDEFCSAFYEGF